MINYYKILEMHLQGISQRIIPSSTGHSRDKDSIQDALRLLSIAFHLSHEKDEMRIKPRSTLVVTGLLRLSSLETLAPSGPMAAHQQCVFRKGFPP